MIAKKQHQKCKAKCCATIDFEQEFWEKHQDKVITKPVAMQPFPGGKRLWAATESGYCPFLREDYLCNIYEDRPVICREYGSESTSYMSCPYLRKDGTERSRQERRSIERVVDKSIDRLIKANKETLVQLPRSNKKYDV